MDDDQDFKVKLEMVDSLTDSEYEFEFSLDDKEYAEVLQELKAGSDEETNIKRTDLECPYPGCHKTFTRNYNLTRHMQHHDFGNPTTGQVCHICGKTVKGSYSCHLKTHDQVKQFKCNECGKEFRQKYILNNHMLIHKDIKPYECQWCFKKFRQKYTLKDHMKRHTGIKEHICDLCGKDFTEKIYLQKHAAVHLTNKPHQCTVCFMSFRHKSSLSRHCKIHNQTTQCHICHRAFRYESFLKKHYLTCHADDPSLPRLNIYRNNNREKLAVNESKEEMIEEFVEEEEAEEEEEEENEQPEENVVVVTYDQNGSQAQQYQQYSQPSTSKTVIVNRRSLN